MTHIRIQRQALPTTASAPAARNEPPVRSRPPAGLSIQKMSISSPDDFHEREADRVADEILRMPEPGGGVIQRMCNQCSEEKELQRQADDDDDDDMVQTMPDRTLQRLCMDCDGGEEDDDVVMQKRIPGAAAVRHAADPIPSGQGRPMTAGERSFFEPRYGADFSAVRIHSGGEAAAKAAEVRARAFTVRNDIVLGSGEGSIATTEGRRLMAHELTHVVQQGAAQTSRLDRVRITPLQSAHVQRAVGDSCYISVPQGLYAGLGDNNLGVVGAGVKFTNAQRAQILAANNAVHGSGPLALNVTSHYNSDVGGGALIGDTEVCHVLARIDHIYPKAGGGCNSVRNAAVISATQNLAKSNNYPWGGHNGRRVLDPTTGTIYNSRPQAIAAGANNAAALP